MVGVLANMGLVVEGILIFGGTMAFGFWQLYELKKLKKEREARAAKEANESSDE